MIAEAALSWFIIGRIASNPAGSGGGEICDTRCQNSVRRSTRRSAGLPAISAALIAPIETPATQSGATPASASPDTRRPGRRRARRRPAAPARSDRACPIARQGPDGSLRTRHAVRRLMPCAYTPSMDESTCTDASEAVPRSAKGSPPPAGPGESLLCFPSPPPAGPRTNARVRPPRRGCGRGLVPPGNAATIAQ